MEEPKDTRVRMLKGTFDHRHGDLHKGREYLTTRSRAAAWVRIGNAEYVIDAPRKKAAPASPSTEGVEASE